MSLKLSFVNREKGQSHRVKRSLYHSSSTARRCVRQGQHELSKLRLEVLLVTDGVQLVIGHCIPQFIVILLNKYLIPYIYNISLSRPSKITLPVSADNVYSISNSQHN